MPLEYRLTGVSMNSAIPAKSTMSSNDPRMAAVDIPMIAPCRKTFSRPVRSG